MTALLLCLYDCKIGINFSVWVSTSHGGRMRWLQSLHLSLLSLHCALDGRLQEGRTYLLLRLHQHSEVELD